MGDPKGFLKFKREHTEYRPIGERVKDYKEVFKLRSEAKVREQAGRCMDCGTPFCHWSCPVGNLIPEWNNMAQMGQWKKAYEHLAETNNFPEITGRVCPALCEYSCVLGINDEPVTIRENELNIIEHAFKEGYVKPKKIKNRTGKKVAVVGAGPAGLAAADELNKYGHSVTVFEKDEELGGILRYGIPDFKLDKSIIERRVDILKKEGIKFKTNTTVGTDYPAEKLMKDFDAVCLTGGSRKPRDLNIPGRELNGIVFAMDYLTQSNMFVSGKKMPEGLFINAKGKNVVVIGGGDTGADCVGTANRQGAKCVVQIEVMPKPPMCRPEDQPWPRYPFILKTSTSHEEGADRQWSILTKKFTGSNGNVKKLHCIKVEFKKTAPNTCASMVEIPGSEFVIDADLAILAVGFVHPEHEGLLEKLGVQFDTRGNVKTDDNFMTKVKGVFAAGDMHRGQSLVVWAFQEGRLAASSINNFLKK